MYCKDFEYDGQRLSDYGCVICNILNNTDATAVNIGSHITFNTIAMPSINKFKRTSSQYDTAFTTTFEICKFDCMYRNDNYFTPEEVSHISRWLNKKSLRKFKMIYEYGELADVYYKGSFNIEPVKYGENIIGLQLILQTEAPFAYYDEIEHIMEFTENNLVFSIYDKSDEIGFIYPSFVKIEILSDGDFELTNSLEPNRITSIKNCVAGEILTLIENKSISTSEVHSTLFNDFNYRYPRICNTNKDIYGYGIPTDNMENIFTVNLPCTITLSYSPVCKMGII